MVKKFIQLSYDKVFYYSSLAFAFTIPLSRAAVSFFVLWFIFLFITRRDYIKAWQSIKTSRALVAIGAFFTFMFASMLWSSQIHEALNQIRLYSYWIIIPILGVSLKKEWLLHMITTFIGGMFVSEIIAYGMYFELWTFKGHGSDYPSPFMFHIHYSIFLAVTAIILLSRVLSDRYTWRIKLPMLLFFLTSRGHVPKRIESYAKQILQ